MSKVAVVFWSQTGNTEALANAVVEGAQAAGAEVTVFSASEFTPDKVAEFDTIGFGCPAMGAEVLEEEEFEPMFAEVEGELSGKTVGLFGSWGWGEGVWMDEWKERTVNDGANVLDPVICMEAPDDEALEAAKNLGAQLAA